MSDDDDPISVDTSQTLMKMGSDGRIKVNFSDRLVEVMKEVRQLLAMGFAVPRVWGTRAAVSALPRAYSLRWCALPCPMLPATRPKRPCQTSRVWRNACFFLVFSYAFLF